MASRTLRDYPKFNELLFDIISLIRFRLLGCRPKMAGPAYLCIGKTTLFSESPSN